MYAFSKDSCSSFHRFLILQILSNPDNVTHKKSKVQILGYAHAQKSCFVTSNWQENITLVLQISRLAIPILIGLNQTDDLVTSTLFLLPDCAFKKTDFIGVT